jgi:hypothetical protein
VKSRSGDAQTESILALIREDDGQVAALCERLSEDTTNPQIASERLVGRLCDTLSIQRLAEEEVLYPTLRTVDEKLVFGFLLAGLGISMRIGEVRDPCKARALRDASTARLIAMVRRNLSERSQILLPFASSHLSETQLVWLGDDYLERKARLWSVGDTARPSRAMALANKPVGVRSAVSLSLWRKRRGLDESHPQ